jgi:hypothetical protein
MMMLLWKEKRERRKDRGRMQGHAPATGVVKRGKTRKPKKPEGEKNPEGKDEVLRTATLRTATLRTAICHSQICAFPRGKQQGGGSILLPRGVVGSRMLPLLWDGGPQ